MIGEDIDRIERIPDGVEPSSIRSTSVRSVVTARPPGIRKTGSEFIDVARRPREHRDLTAFSREPPG
ncbi:hypothetical protein [Halorubrum sp. BOL3-1]|uniref:hypothetical protein n=1 Tax=Halorubrum sp. BOL3-1 TaxID=2497325 RepID=UPI00140A9026|nr:hypothetical protein [Halorubrum sp. BOL3-1]